MDPRVMININGSVCTMCWLVNLQTANLTPWKFTSDHLKILQELKVILDHIVSQELTMAHGLADIPSNISCFRDLRKKTISRLRFMRNARILAQSLEKESRLKKKESASYRRSPSCDDVENDIKRMRSIWFPSPRLGALIVIPVDMF
ncbi:hypothetical protein CU098_007289 [Rhizopus stolonifer]|uniref:Uncharacterized protein n=1 Tax=Rhizopus stolonifer TaxID=4846 RepID=A0A367IV71_RHIST|nr:hypothetical protein CU098_007289 [Rhizopus stolonifer]